MAPTPAHHIGYPVDRLLAVIDDPARAASAMAALRGSGIPTRDLEVLRGEEGADRMDGTGAVSGAMGRIRKALAFTMADQLVDFAWYEAALRDGRTVVMARVRGDPAKATAVATLKAHGAHFVNYYGRFATEEVVRWRGPEPDVAAILKR
jgi:hypothetical protein